MTCIVWVFACITTEKGIIRSMTVYWSHRCAPVYLCVVFTSQCMHMNMNDIAEQNAGSIELSGADSTIVLLNLDQLCWWYALEVPRNDVCRWVSFNSENNMSLQSCYRIFRWNVHLLHSRKEMRWTAVSYFPFNYIKYSAVILRVK